MWNRRLREFCEPSRWERRKRWRWKPSSPSSPAPTNSWKRLRKLPERPARASRPVRELPGLKLRLRTGRSNRLPPREKRCPKRDPGLWPPRRPAVWPGNRAWILPKSRAVDPVAWPPCRDVQRHIEGKSAPPAAALAGRRIALSCLRRTIGQRIQQSFQTAPHFTATVEVDMTEAERQREILARQLEEKIGCKLTLTAFLVKAVARVLGAHPFLNALLDGKEELPRATSVRV